MNLTILLTLCVGIIIGMLSGLALLRSRSLGNLIIADDPEEGTYIFLEISKSDVDTIRHQEIIKLTVIDKGHA